MGAIKSPVCAKGHKWDRTRMTASGRVQNICSICELQRIRDWRAARKEKEFITRKLQK
jgi:hypothetical protein